MATCINGFIVVHIHGIGLNISYDLRDQSIFGAGLVIKTVVTINVFLQ